MFTCAIPGVYQFSFLCTSYNGPESVNLWKNKVLVFRSFRVYQGGHHLSSGDTVLRLKTGDKVWLEVTNGNTVLSTKSFFSGHLLYTL